MHHYIHIPSDGLSEIIHAIVLIEMDKEEMQHEKILPNPTNALIIQHGDPTSYSFDGIRYVRFPRYYFALAAASKTGIYMTNSGVNRSVIIIFKPGIIFPYFGFPLSEASEILFLSPEEILGKSVIPFCESMGDTGLTDRDRINKCEQYFGSFCRKNTGWHTTTEAMQKIIHAGGFISIPELTNHFCVTKRTLNRRFTFEQGISPYAYARIIRCHAALDMIRSRKYSWQDIIHHFHYFDQAHFIHDFRNITGYAPREYLKKQYHFEEFIRKANSF